MNKESNYLILKNSLKIALPFVILIIVVVLSISSLMNKSEFESYRNIEENTADEMVERIQEEIMLIVSDLTILASLNEVESLLEDTSNQEIINNLNGYFLSLSKNRKVYDQVRLIDEFGMELIRVNYKDGKPEIALKENLQNKRGRYYFDDAFKLNQGEVFVSPLDLNIENGKIEKPLKPMIRFATPVFDKQGNKRGIALLNFFGNEIINHSLDHQSLTLRNKIMLLNSGSYWLKGSVIDQEWGFMYEDKTDVNFSNSYPEEWKIIENEETSQIETKNGLFTSRTVYPIPEGLISSSGSEEAFKPSVRKISSEDYFWKAVSFIPCDILYKEQKTRNQLAAFIAFFLVVISFLVSWKIAKVNYLRKLANRKLKESENNLRDMNVAKDKLFSIIAHDLKSPFNSMLGFSEILDENYDNFDTEEKKKFIGIIHKELKNTFKLLENLLYWSRSQRGTIDFNPERLNLYFVSEETIDILNLSAKNKSIKLTNQIPKDIFVEADIDMLSLVIRNLLSNAIKFTPKGGEITIKAQLKTDENNKNYTEVTVTDTGVGIKKELLKKIFKVGENTSTKGTENEKGTGLGLILCKEFVEKHGGKIWVESEVGKGSEFIFTLYGIV